jgi:hypothetical protein
MIISNILSAKFHADWNTFSLTNGLDSARLNLALDLQETLTKFTYRVTRLFPPGKVVISFQL